MYISAVQYHSIIIAKEVSSLVFQNHHNHPEPTGKKCPFCDGTAMHKRDHNMKIIVHTDQKPYCDKFCEMLKGQCPFCHGTGLDRTH